MTIKLIVGLANPNPEYIATRHNVGSWYIKMLAYRYSKLLKKENKFLGYISKLTLGSSFYLLIPNTFMNFSGKAVAKIATFYGIKPEEILVAHDELDLLPGHINIKLGGKYNSHNGIKDIIFNLNHDPNFYRLRIGIGHPGDKNKVVNFVLGEPSFAERKLINNAIDRAVRCTEIIMSQNIMNAMNCLYNKYHEKT